MPEYIGRYRIIEQIGKGAMARVYKAHDPQINRTLAIKVLRKERCIDKEYRKRFVRESRAAGKLSHPNIVTVFDVGEHDDQPYIVMELLPGIALDTLMKSEIRLNHDQIIDIAVQLARSLHYAHTSGIVHRDIKPSNIVCNLDDNGEIQLKITDFGIAHIEDSALTQHTQAGDVLGTPLYMSPEQVHGKRIDGRSDLFSLGVILYQLFSGRKPFKGSSIATVLHKISTHAPEPINCLVEDLPEALHSIIHRLLEKDPEKRYQTGKELAQAISNLHTTTRPRHSSPDSVTTPPSIAGSSRIVISMSMGMLALFLCGAAWFSLQQTLTQNKQQLYQSVGHTMLSLFNREYAESLLDEDWTAIELFTDELAKRHDVSYMSVTDHTGMIRGHSNKQLIGKTFLPQGRRDTGHDDNNRYFSSPVRYRDKTVGQVEFRLAAGLFEQVSVNHRQTMLFSAIAISLLVSVLAYLLSGRTVKKARGVDKNTSKPSVPARLAKNATASCLDDTLSDEQTLAK